MGTEGTNGLLPSEFHANKGALLTAAGLPLVAGGALNPAISALFATPAGRRTFDYAMQCGAPAGVCLDQGAGSCGEGGLLTTTAAWPGRGLDPGAKADLFGCVAALLNAAGQTVPVRLTGAAVHNEEGVDLSGFGFEEALWLATPGAAPASPVAFDVWPLPDLSNLCGAPRALASLERQVCGENPAGCQLRLRTDLGACQAVEGVGVTCDGRRAIKTWLKAADVAKRHPHCAAP